MTIFLIVILILLAIILIAIMPSLRRHKDRELLQTTMFAHRGLYNKENM